MFLGFIPVVVLGLVLVQLGSYSVWVTIFSAALKIAAAVIAVIVALLAWNKYSKTGDLRPSKSGNQADAIDVIVGNK